VLNNPLVIIDPNGEGWVQLGLFIGWDPDVESQKQAEQKWGKTARFLPVGTILIITGGHALAGQMVILDSAAQFIPLGKPRPVPIKEIEWYGGDGERFLLAYFKFAAENIVLSAAGAKLMDGIEALIQLAKAKRAGKAALEVLEATKKAEGVCFAAGTTVLTEAGYKPIEELKPGDVVLSFDPDCGEPAWQQVTNCYLRTATEVLDIRVESVKISTTPEHPFWVAGRGWTEAKELRAGDILVTKNGRKVKVVSLEARRGQFRVYNIEVPSLHSYYVSDLGILVHNQCGINISPVAEDWVVKGAHISVGGIELAVRPGLDGSIVFKSVFASQESGRVAAAIKRAEEALRADVRFQQALLRSARAAVEYLGGSTSALGRARSGEVRFLVKALEKLGGQ
jgi:pretoxin HINT domain-containing protein